MREAITELSCSLAKSFQSSIFVFLVRMLAGGPLGFSAILLHAPPSSTSSGIAFLSFSPKMIFCTSVNLAPNNPSLSKITDVDVNDLYVSTELLFNRIDGAKVL